MTAKTKGGTDPKVDAYFSKAEAWPAELERLRTILLDCHLTEALKWGSPCYSYGKHNIAIMGELKDACVLGFFKGTLLSDSQGILLKPGENTQSARSIKFTSVREIAKLEPVLRAYIHEAMEVERAGLKVAFTKSADLDVPEELQHKMKEMPALKKAFQALTPGRRKGYLLHFSAPKQAKTRVSRIEKCIERILEGKGLNDR
jgi:uncharacterized protein YdeI (YjbR/CyaY-like superfamily)